MLRLLILLAAFGSVACSPAYVLRAAYEESRILWKREPIARVLEDPGLPDEHRRKLEIVLAARDFAADSLGFEVGGSYASLSRITNPAVVHVLSAAHRDRLERVTWWYPIVGRVPYKGFFDEEAAALAAAGLEDDGFDTYVRPSAAFSTLGWFDDPLLSTLLRLEPVALVEVVLHELFHATLFVPGEMSFNESAAVFAGHRGAIEFFCGEASPIPEACEISQRRWRDAQRVSGFVADVVSEVDRFYEARDETATETERRAVFVALHEKFREISFETDRYRRLSVRAWNNAVLLHERTYFHDLERFEAFYVGIGRMATAVDVLRVAIDEHGDPFTALRAATPATAPTVAQGSSDSSRRIP